MKNVIFANILEYNVRGLGQRTTVAELAAWDAPGEDLADLAVFWGDSESVVVTPRDLEPRWLQDLRHLIDLRVSVLSTGSRTRSLCQDALDGGLLENLGAQEEILVRAWGPTPQLATVLRSIPARTAGLPEIDAFPLAWELDSKAGFRHFLAHANPGEHVQMPTGFILPDVETAIECASNFASQGRCFLIKAARGTSGFGTLRIPAADSARALDRSLRLIRSRMRFESHWSLGPIVAEEWIGGSEREEVTALTADFEVGSDGSVEYLGGGPMRIRHGQYYEGVLCGYGTMPEERLKRLREIGFAVGAAVAAHGYTGLFDLDFVLGENGELYITEMNARRASPSHALALGRLLEGPDWDESFSALAVDHFVVSGASKREYSHVREVFETFRCNHRGARIHAIPTMVSSLKRAVPYLGYVIIARGSEAVHEASDELQSMLEQFLGIQDRSCEI